MSRPISTCNNLPQRLFPQSTGLSQVSRRLPALVMLSVNRNLQQVQRANHRPRQRMLLHQWDPSFEPPHQVSKLIIYNHIRLLAFVVIFDSMTGFNDNNCFFVWNPNNNSGVREEMSSTDKLPLEKTLPMDPHACQKT